MLTKTQEKLIRSLHTKKGRERSGLTLVEGEKVIHSAQEAGAIEYTFTPQDTAIFNQLVTTETPQSIAAVARIPKYTQTDIESAHTIVVLDGVQDPGNVGSLLRLALGFNATLILIDSADVSNPKVIRSSAGALFHVPWISLNRNEAVQYIQQLNRPIYRLEKSADNESTTQQTNNEPAIIIAGSEGQGIQLPITGTSLSIAHNPKLESLNVTHAVAIILHNRYQVMVRQAHHDIELSP